MRLVKANGAELTAEESEQITVVNNPLASIFESIFVGFNGQEFSQLTNHQVGYTENAHFLLSFSKEVSENSLRTFGFASDDPFYKVRCN